ncbi:MAG TPA: Lrp/AsnC family transcriptional regulator [Symbiobacteriaceae bacterium]
MDHAKRREILHLLQSDARLTAEHIAAMVGEEPEAVAQAIAEMEADRVLLRYTAVVDWDKMDTDTVTAIIDVKISPQRDVGFDRLARRIARFPEVRACYLVSGAYDLSVIVEAGSLKEVARFVSQRLSTLEGVASTTTHFILKRYKHDGVLFEDAESDERLAVTP